jgi:hypothetical protein
MPLEKHELCSLRLEIPGGELVERWALIFETLICGSQLCGSISDAVEMRSSLFFALEK